MAAPKGNQFWKLRSKHGRDKLFTSPELLWKAACEYFEWCDENPLLESKAFNTAKEGVKDHPLAKMRAYTLQGLCLYLDCNTGYFNDFEKAIDLKSKDGEGFSVVITRIRETIYNQKFTGAAADLLNANIIARDLGLADKKEHTGKGGGPIETSLILPDSFFNKPDLPSKEEDIEDIEP